MLLFRLAVLSASGAGLYILSGIGDGGIRWANLIYYTNLSNLACFALYILLAAKSVIEIINEHKNPPANDDLPAANPNPPEHKNPPARIFETATGPFVKGAVLMMLAVTMLVYHFMLSATGFVMQVNSNPQIKTANILLHYAAPILAIAEWFLFDKKNSFRRYYPPMWLSVPFVYTVFVYIRAGFGGNIGQTGSRFPYFFFDIDAVGLTGVIVYAAVLFCAFLLLGYIFYFLDFALGRFEKTTQKNGQTK